MQSLNHYFPGGNTPEGFFSFYHKILSSATTGSLAVIKGGPGTGKSTFMKRVANALEQLGHRVSYLHCSSDPDSLDGIYLPEKNTAMIDGTAPHVTDPRYPGSHDTIFDFCPCINRDAMDSDAVVRLHRKVGDYFQKGYGFLRAANSLLNTLRETSEKHLSYGEINRFAANIRNRLTSVRGKGEERTCFLSAITPYGCRNYLDEDLSSYHTVMLQSSTGDPTGVVMKRVADACRMQSPDMIVCPCPMNPSLPEHLIFPESNLAVTVSNGHHSLSSADEVIWFSDFCHCEHEETAVTSFETLLSSAVAEFSKAKEAHDRLEELYLPNVDFARIEAMQDRAISFLTR